MILIVTSKNELFDEIQSLVTYETDFRLMSYAIFLQEVVSGGEHILFTPVLIDIIHADPDTMYLLKKEHMQFGALTMAIINHPAQRQAAAEIGASDYFMYPFDSQLEINKLEKLQKTSFAESETWDELQFNATQDAFITLTARLIGEKLDIKTIVSRTLEQTLPLFEGVSGSIWLLSPDQQSLMLESYLSMHISFVPPRQIPLGKGFIGSVVKEGKTLHITGEEAIKDERFDPTYDYCFIKKESAIFLIVPLRNFGEIIGALMICSESETLISNRQISLLEGIADLATSAIVNAKLVEGMRENAAQQKALYEMSQQVTGGLDLLTTLKRALQWSERLCETEYALLWFYESATDELVLRDAIGLGIDEKEAETVRIPVSYTPFANTINTMGTICLQEIRVPPILYTMFTQLTIEVFKNVLIVPLRYKGKTAAFLTLINKVGGEFTEADKTLVSTAGEMISVALGNSLLHETTLELMDERQKLTNLAIQRERLVTVGRLTASLAHEINNPMQAIRGALTLALEDLNDPKELDFFIRMSLTETDRVVKLVSRMRQIYRPEMDQPEALNVLGILNESISVAQKELTRQDVDLQTTFSETPIQIYGISNQIHLVFLSLLLNFSDSIGEIGGGVLSLDLQASESMATIIFTASSEIWTENSWLHTFNPDEPYKETNVWFGAHLSQDIITNHEGKVTIEFEEKDLILTIQIPRITT